MSAHFARQAMYVHVHWVCLSKHPSSSSISLARFWNDREKQTTRSVRIASSALRVLATVYAFVHWVVRVRTFLALHPNIAVFNRTCWRPAVSVSALCPSDHVRSCTLGLPVKALFLVIHLPRAVLHSAVLRRAGVQTLSFEYGTDSARRSPWSASVCTRYEHFAHLLRSVQNAKWQRIEKTGF